MRTTINISSWQPDFFMLHSYQGNNIKKLAEHYIASCQFNHDPEFRSSVKLTHTELLRTNPLYVFANELVNEIEKKIK